MNRLFHTLQAKLLLTVCGGIFLIVMFASAALVELTDVMQTYAERNLQITGTRAEVDLLNIEFKRQVQEWKNVLLRGHDPAQMDKHWKSFLTIHGDIQSRGRQLVSAVPDDEVLHTLTAFIDDHAELLKGYEKGREAYIAAGYDPQVGDAAVKGVDRAPSQAMSDLSQMMSDKALEAAKEAGDARRNSMIAAVGWSLGLAVLVTASLIWILRKQLLGPMRELSGHIHLMAQGDLTENIRLDRSDELGELGAELNRMQQQMRTMLAQVQESVVNLQRTSAEMNMAADDIYRATSETEHFSSQVATAITEMAQTVGEVAGNASGAADATQSADQSADEGLAVMERTLSMISEAASEIANTSLNMNQLERDANSVGAVLDVIKGIAEQTNLLALNAAIEAARAGEQGRGFAVVADEVRALARKTQESTEEIQHIIVTLQRGAAAASQAISAGSKKTSDSVVQAGEAGRYFKQISHAVSDIRDMNTQIATAAEQQSVVAEEISRNIVSVSELAKVAQENARGSRERSRSLDVNARALSAQVDKFRLS